MRSKVALGLGLLLLLGCRTKNMAMTPMPLNEFAIRYTAAWCSHEPQRVPELFAEHSSLTINRASPPLVEPPLPLRLRAS